MTMMPRVWWIAAVARAEEAAAGRALAVPAAARTRIARPRATLVRVERFISLLPFTVGPRQNELTSEGARGQAPVEHLARLLGAAHRQPGRVEQADLDEHARLVPVDVLVRDLVAVDLDDGHESELDGLARRLHAGEQPVDRGRVREPDHELVDELVGSDGP